MNALFLDFEQLLLGNVKAIGPYNFYGAAAGGANQKNALECIQYAIEEILSWDVEEAKRKFDSYMIHLLKMERLVEYIIFPQEVPFGDSTYILSLIYPDKVKLNQKGMIENMYQNILDGAAQFPREYFIGQKGFYRFCVCLCYAISKYHPFSTLDELYDFFSSTSGKSFLDKYRLKIPMEHLNINILRCLQTITDDDEDSYMLYTFAEFRLQLETKVSQLQENNM